MLYGLTGICALIAWWSISKFIWWFLFLLCFFFPQNFLFALWGMNFKWKCFEFFFSRPLYNFFFIFFYGNVIKCYSVYNQTFIWYVISILIKTRLILHVQFFSFPSHFLMNCYWGWIEIWLKYYEFLWI